MTGYTDMARAAAGGAARNNTNRMVRMGETFRTSEAGLFFAVEAVHAPGLKAFLSLDHFVIDRLAIPE